MKKCRVNKNCDPFCRVCIFFHYQNSSYKNEYTYECHKVTLILLFGPVEQRMNIISTLYQDNVITGIV